MIKISSKTRNLIFLLLALISISSFIIIEDEDLALNICIGSVVCIVVFAIISVVLNKYAKNVERKIVSTTATQPAKILNAEQIKRTLILQLEILDEAGKYITSLEIRRPTDHQADKYVYGKNITVHVDPRNKYKVLIADIVKGKRKFNFPWIEVLVWGFQIAIFGTIGLTAIFGGSNRKFHDSALIINKDGEEFAWEVHYDNKEKIHLRVYDPIEDKRIFKLKVKKEEELSNGLKFHVAQQGSKVMVYGVGKTPVFDAYDANAMEKLYSTDDFIAKNKALSKGIASSKTIDMYHRILKEDVVEIISNDGNKVYYNVAQNEFYNFKEIALLHFYSYDTALLNKYNYTFALTYVMNSADRYQLYRVNATKKKYAHELNKFAGMNNISVESYKEEPAYDEVLESITVTDTINIEDIPGIEGIGAIVMEYSETGAVEVKDKYTFKLLADYETFINAKFLYLDSTIAIVSYNNSAKKDAKEYISCFNKNGKKLFELKQDDFPNADEMDEQGHIPLRVYELEVARNKNHVYIFFDRFGAVGIDIETGKVFWKHE